MPRRPESVRAAGVPAGTSAEPDWADPALDFTNYSSTGVIGSVDGASAELGEQLWRACVAAVASIFKEYA